MYNFIILCAIVAAATACAPNATASAVDAAAARRKPVTCIPEDISFEITLDTPFGEKEHNEEIVMHLRSEILRLLSEAGVNIEKYGEYHRRTVESNGMLGVLYEVENSAHHCDDFKYFAKGLLDGAKQVKHVFLTCGCKGQFEF